MHKLVLVDGDIIINKASFAAETRWYEVVGGKEPVVFKYKREADKYVKENPGTESLRCKDVLPFPVVKSMIDQMLQGIKNELKCDNILTIVGPPSGTKIFRHDVYPQYKGNRKDSDRPDHLKAARQYLIDTHKATVANDMETDDLLGIIQCEEEASVIASIDKDLLQIPGHHYNIDTKEVILSTDPGELSLSRNKSNSLVLRGFGFKWFAVQMLLGDKVDNIPKPVRGLGPKKAFELMEGKENIDDVWKVVEKTYHESKLDMTTNGMLLWILREANKDWRDVL